MSSSEAMPSPELFEPSIPVPQVFSLDMPGTVNPGFVPGAHGTESMRFRSVTPNPQTGSRLFNLPDGVRKKIFEYVLLVTGAIQPYPGSEPHIHHTVYWAWWVRGHGDWINSCLLRTCRRAYQEGLPILYSNMFLVHEAHAGAGTWPDIRMTRRNFDMIQTVVALNLGEEITDLVPALVPNSPWPALFTDPPRSLRTVHLFFGDPYKAPRDHANEPRDVTFYPHLADVIAMQAARCRESGRGPNLETIILDDRCKPARVPELSLAFDLSPAWSRRRFKLMGLTVLGPIGDRRILERRAPGLKAWSFVKPEDRREYLFDTPLEERWKAYSALFESMKQARCNTAALESAAQENAGEVESSETAPQVQPNLGSEGREQEGQAEVEGIQAGSGGDQVERGKDAAVEEPFTTDPWVREQVENFLRQTVYGGEQGNQAEKDKHQPAKEGDQGEKQGAQPEKEGDQAGKEGNDAIEKERDQPAAAAAATEANTDDPWVRERVRLFIRGTVYNEGWDGYFD